MDDNKSAENLARRHFLARCGKFAAVTPPTIALLLSSTSQNYATAASGGNPNGGNGNHFGWGRGN